ncbi:exodeoxyribonuclease VII small subunit [Humibacter sp.]|uniref:exodeoxyribonuclease VII small subunit n=1 Tax=Microbacteriaceae TaxID=85023 RepID=UPI003F7D050A
MDTMPTSEISALSYEEARDELVRVVTELEQGSATLEESIALWERGEALARHCEEWLIGAKARLDAARAGAVQPGTAGASDPE